MKGRKRNLEEVSSFFCWFNDCNSSESDDIAETIKDEIWPNPLQFFLVRIIYVQLEYFFERFKPPILIIVRQI